MKEWVRQQLGPPLPRAEHKPAEPIKEKIVPENQQPIQGVSFTLEMLQQLVSTAVATAIQETKRLPPEEQEELDQKKLKLGQARRSRALEAIQDERVRRQQQLNCGLGGHIKYSESSADTAVERKHAFRGQVNNDNCCRAICIRCQKVFPPFKVTQENMKSGMALGNVTRLTAASLYEAHRRSFPQCKECEKGACAVRDLRELKQGHLDPEPEILPDGKVKAAELVMA